MKIHRLWLLVVALLVSFAWPPPAHGGVRVTVRPGSWSDVVATPDGFRFVRATAAAVIVERPDVPTGTEIWQTPLPEPILYLRAAISMAGEVRAIAQGNQSGNAYVVTASGVTSLGGSFGQNATAIGWFVGSGFTYYVQTSPTTYSVFNSAGCGPCVVTMPATSQGFRDIQPDGQVRRGDDYMIGTFLGRQLWTYAQRGAITIGQCDPPAICAVAEGRVFSVVTGNAFEPHLALGDGGVFAIATRTERGAALAIVSPPYPAGDTTAPAPVPPVPVPAPTPAPQTRIAPNEIETVARAIQRHPEIDTRDEVARGRIVDYAAADLNRGADRPWGRKSRNAQGTDLNTDGLTYLRPDGLFEIYDVIGGSMGAATWEGYGPFRMGENGYWVPARPVTTTPGPGPTPQPTPGGITRAELDAALAKQANDLKIEFGGLLVFVGNRLDALEARPPLDLPALQAAIDAALSQYWICGKTEADRIGLQHRVCLGLSPRPR